MVEILEAEIMRGCKDCDSTHKFSMTWLSVSFYVIGFCLFVGSGADFLGVLSFWSFIAAYKFWKAI